MPVVDALEFAAEELRVRAFFAAVASTSGRI
jgi:hypothetical protein